MPRSKHRKVKPCSHRTKALRKLRNGMQYTMLKADEQRALKSSDLKRFDIVID